ncbi:hypothetical protein [Methylocaldum gracile]|jgi:hypothetical protein|uniref:hypothetical protein n=1 Tax=unclassified Methylocaldum TaxID=2622260 RepID=UPI00105E8934
MTVCDWSAEAPLPDAMPRPSVFVGKGLPTYDRAPVGRESFPDATLQPSVFAGKGLPTYDRAPVGRESFPDATARPSVFAGRVATKATVCDWERIADECLNQFTRAEGANDFRRAGFAVRAR